MSILFITLFVNHFIPFRSNYIFVNKKNHLVSTTTYIHFKLQKIRQNSNDKKMKLS